MSSPTSNRVSFAPPPEVLQAILLAIATLKENLQPNLIELGPEDIRTMPKMGPKTVDFVGKTLSYIRANPQFKPPFVEIDAFADNYAAVDTLRDLLQPLSLLVDMIEDTLTQSGSDALNAALACYQAFKAGAKLNMPGAAVIADDLSARFADRAARPAPQA